MNNDRERSPQQATRQAQLHIDCWASLPSQPEIVDLPSPKPTALYGSRTSVDSLSTSWHATWTDGSSLCGTLALFSVKGLLVVYAAGICGPPAGIRGICGNDVLTADRRRKMARETANPTDRQSTRRSELGATPHSKLQSPSARWIMEKVICIHIDWLLRLAVRSVQASSRSVPIRICLSHVGWLTAAGQAKAHGQWPLKAHRARLARDVVDDRRGCLDSSKFLTGLVRLRTRSYRSPQESPTMQHSRYSRYGVSRRQSAQQTKIMAPNHDMT
ncbi:hypothetical protein K456DRAFT_1921431 [Colletotrichum gloeosporioides 23]|nr:hypothetical protein K456DRAFT_1921431 [Colletotrichum gloeosporioides 23]